MNEKKPNPVVLMVFMIALSLMLLIFTKVMILLMWL